jgi:hypothetical protein
MSAPGQAEPAEPSPGAESVESTTPAPQTEAPPGLDKLYERMEQMAAGQRQMLDTLTEVFTPPSEEEGDPNALPGEFYDETGGLTDDGQQVAALQEFVDRRVQATIGPQEAQRLVRDRDEQYELLKETHPELADDQVAQPILNACIRWAHENGVPELVDTPGFVDLVERAFIAQQYEAQRREAESQRPNSVVLESAQGAGRAQTAPEEIDWEKRVIEAAQKDGPRI